VLETLHVIAHELAPFLPHSSRVLSESLCAPLPNASRERWNVLPSGA
jgi:hypothetical protein